MKGFSEFVLTEITEVTVLDERSVVNYTRQTFVKDNAQKLSKEEEIELCRVFNTKYGRNIVIDEFFFDMSIHAKARFMQRASDMSKTELYDFFEKALDAIYARPRKEYLVFSRKHNRGAVIENFQSEKRMRVITVLPVGSRYTKRGVETTTLLAEQEQLLENLEVVFID